jgi:hypothetical protein
MVDRDQVELTLCELVARLYADPPPADWVGRNVDLIQRAAKVADDLAKQRGATP